ncbi:Mannosylfructose-phosphate synthase [Serratia fonticola]|uniref:glycosyltransferase family 4 protein n=1 Tax=Serratia fonticola TaxID=47917 RepID=UPI00217BD973|nr:glycosyltransferase family 4 protein [Serratia fonticola]CAI1853848.1 Mannosylfructose-phosphate synthase [Serratia fonticola]
MNIYQLGMGWFPEKEGGLNRYFYDLNNHNYNDDVKYIPCVMTASHAEKPIAYNSLGYATDSVVKRLLSARYKFKKLVSETKPDLIVSHFSLYTLPIIIFNKTVPLVVHFQGPWAYESIVENNNKLGGYIKKSIENLVYRRATKFIVLSQSFKELLVERYGVAGNSVHVIPAGVDLNKFKLVIDTLPVKSQLGMRQDKITLVCVRRLAKRMGIDVLIKAVSRLKLQGLNNLELHIVGKGNEEVALKALVSELGLNEEVKFAGFVADELLPNYYQAADFAIVPTIALEGFGLITLEAMASGATPIVTDIGGLPEVVRPFDAELIAKSNSVDSLAECLQKNILSNKHSRESCRLYVEENFSWELINQRVLAVYKNAIVG